MGNLGFQELLLIGIVIGLFLVPYVFYLITAQKTLQAISPQNRQMKPAQVWLMLIPFFGYFWLFKIIDAIAISTNLEFAGYGLSQKDTMRTAGLGWGIFLVAGLFFGFLYVIAYIAFVVHWIKVNEARKLIFSMKEIAQQTDDLSIFK